MGRGLAILAVTAIVTLLLPDGWRLGLAPFLIGFALFGAAEIAESAMGDRE